MESTWKIIFSGDLITNKTIKENVNKALKSLILFKDNLYAGPVRIFLCGAPRSQAAERIK